MSGNIPKLAVNSFLAGLILWYGIEKLFMLSIGISAFGIAITVVVLQAANVVLDIPTGVLADRWSRKGVLLLSSLAIIAASLIMAASHSLALYVVGTSLYALHVVTAATTSDAFVYDTLKDEGRPELYSKYGGLVGALNLTGYAVGSIAGGVMTAWLHNYRLVFVLAIIPGVINLALVLLMREPARHQTIRAKHPVRSLVAEILAGSRAVVAVGMLQALIMIMCLLWITEAFKEGFGQLYFLHYVSCPALIGALFAGFYLVWAAGEYLAHKLDAHLNLLLVATVVPLVIMCFIDQWLSLVLFMIQAFAAGALFVQITARIHDVTPSAIRASVMSVRTFVGRLVTVVAIPLMGTIIDHAGAIWALRFATIPAVAAFIVWLYYQQIAKSKQAISSASIT